MTLFDALSTSSSGLNAQRIRMNVISGNIANVNTTRTPEGGAYRRRETIVAALPPDKNFLEELQTLENDQGARHSKVVGIVEDARPPIMKFDPDHPDANEEGFVEMPNVSISEEMVNLMQAKRTYEANIAVFNTTKKMAMNALEIGRR